MNVSDLTGNQTRDLSARSVFTYELRYRVSQLLYSYAYLFKSDLRCSYYVTMNDGFISYEMLFNNVLRIKTVAWAMGRFMGRQGRL
jgi:hypothetical protein